jgi:acyl-CoA synthetase (AMP-forming)/AMP-acid ligase II
VDDASPESPDLTPSRTAQIQARAQANWAAVRALQKTGLMKPKVAGAVSKWRRTWGSLPPTGYAAGAQRHTTRTALIDDDGPLSFGELHNQTNALANALLSRGYGPLSPIALLCRNSRWFVYAATAIMKTGAPTLYLNTGFSGPQIAELLKREGATAVIYDQEFAELVEGHVGHVELIPTKGTAIGRFTCESAMAATHRLLPPAPEKLSSQIILTAGTTGLPKGAKRPDPKGLQAISSVFQVIPWSIDDIHFVAAPMFHALGNGGWLVAASMGHTMICQNRFDPEDVLSAMAAHRATALTAVPVMLQRILELPDSVLDSHDTSSLRIVQCSGSALPGSLATRWMDRFGDNLYNMFASTEAGAVSIATPADMRAAPGTAGRALPGTVLRLFDENDEEVLEPGVPGRIFSGSDLQFEGYTGGESKAMVSGLMSIGDVGYLDTEGRLFVGGRDDDMIVSGGENVFPREVEDLLADHPAVLEIAVIGVEDEDFGARLIAFVVLRPGQDLDADAVKAHVKANLAAYKVPRSVTFLDELPRNQAGKIVKRELPTEGDQP